MSRTRRSQLRLFTAELLLFLTVQCATGSHRSRTPQSDETSLPRSGNIGRDSDTSFILDRDDFRCSAKEPHDLAEVARGERSFNKFKSIARMSNGFSRQAGSVTIDVYYHVIQSTSGAGAVSDYALDQQIEVLNKAFSGNDESLCGNGNGASTDTIFRFKKAGVDRTLNNDWWGAQPDTKAEKAMKSALRQGDCSDLNFYINRPGDGFLGWATFPTDCAKELKNDGIVCYHETLPGGNLVKYNEGDTAVHEIGHWLGLLHTFQGGCWNGDRVDDTPAQKRPSKGCSGDTNSCWSPGIDPVHNYMDYASDCCMYQFTNGQSERMNYFHQNYRQGSATESPVSAPIKNQSPVLPSAYPTSSSVGITVSSPHTSSNIASSLSPSLSVFPEDEVVFEGTWGEWKQWEGETRDGHYACGAEIRFDDSFPFWNDMTSANGLQFTFCSVSNWYSQTVKSIYDGERGNWKGVQMCPDGFFIAGARVRYQDSSWWGDNTALNGLKLWCVDPITKIGQEEHVYSGRYGEWKNWVTVDDKFVKMGRLKFEDSSGNNQDDTAWNGLELRFTGFTPGGKQI